MEALFRCNLCGTREAEQYGEIFEIGMCCSRCSLLSMVGPDAIYLPHCPSAGSDVDPAIIAIQQNRDPITVEEYDLWVQTLGNHCTGIDKVREIFTGRKIQVWFEEKHEDSVKIAICDEPITYEVFQACARKHPPSNFECPGISEDTAKNIITVFKAMIFIDMCCANCKKGTAVSKSLKKCSRCKNTYYCSRDCQRSHWKEHKKICKQSDDSDH